MPEMPRDLPHLYLRGSGKAEPYTSKIKPPPRPLPQRDRTTHAEALRTALNTALAAADVQRTERELADTHGVYLDFEITLGSENAAELLENRRKHIELVSVRQGSETTPTMATIFVPDKAADHFSKKIEAYKSENTKKGKPRYQDLIARIQNVALTVFKSLYTDDPALLPHVGQPIWWEIWIRQGHSDVFDDVVRRLRIPVQHQKLVFPDRAVRLVYGDEVTVTRLFLNSDAIAEVRCAKGYARSLC